MNYEFSYSQVNPTGEHGTETKMRENFRFSSPTSRSVFLQRWRETLRLYIRNIYTYKQRRTKLWKLTAVATRVAKSRGSWSGMMNVKRLTKRFVWGLYHLVTTLFSYNAAGFLKISDHSPQTSQLFLSLFLSLLLLLGGKFFTLPRHIVVFTRVLFSSPILLKIIRTTKRKILYCSTRTTNFEMLKKLQIFRFECYRNFL